MRKNNYQLTCSSDSSSNISNSSRLVIPCSVTLPTLLLTELSEKLVRGEFGNLCQGIIIFKTLFHFYYYLCQAIV